MDEALRIVDGGRLRVHVALAAPHAAARVQRIGGGGRRHAAAAAAGVRPALVVMVVVGAREGVERAGRSAEAGALEQQRERPAGRHRPRELDVGERGPPRQAAGHRRVLVVAAAAHGRRVVVVVAGGLVVVVDGAAGAADRHRGRRLQVAVNGVRPVERGRNGGRRRRRYDRGGRQRRREMRDVGERRRGGVPPRRSGAVRDGGGAPVTPGHGGGGATASQTHPADEDGQCGEPAGERQRRRERGLIGAVNDGASGEGCVVVGGGWSKFLKSGTERVSQHYES